MRNFDYLREIEPYDALGRLVREIYEHLQTFYQFYRR